MICEVIPPEIAARLDKAIFAVMEGKDKAEERSVAIEAIHSFHKKAVDSIILGCSEVPLLLDQQDGGLINPAQLLASAAVKYAISSE